MARKLYNKLIRDRIPEIISQDGRTCEVAVMEEEEYRLALADKLVEEAQEASRAIHDATGALTTEIADLYEVIDSLLAAFQIDRDSILAEQRQRRADRGAFQHRLKLLWTE